MGLLNIITPALRAPADCVIRVNDDEIAELYPFLREVTAECSRDEASTARLVFETQRDEHGQWTVQDRGLLAPWKRIVIEAAFGQHTEELFRGFIREIVADYPDKTPAPPQSRSSARTPRSRSTASTCARPGASMHRPPTAKSSPRSPAVTA